MADLPITPSSPIPAAASHAGANNPVKETSARDGAAQNDEDPFQSVLAQEMGLRPEDKAQTKSGASASGEGADRKDDPVLALVAADTAAVPAFVLGSAQLPAATGGATKGTGHGTLGLDARQHRLANAMPTATADTASMELAAEFAAPGKFGPISPGELQHEAVLTPRLLEKPLTPPAIAAAMHSGTGASIQSAQPAATASLDARVGAPGWDKGLGDKLVWMAGQSHQVAQLHLNPPDLGPLKITLTLNNDQASAQFVSGHAVVRDAVENAMPRLREMLAESGIFLGQASVSAESFREQAQPQAQHQPRGYGAPSELAGVDSGFEQRGARQLRPSLGLVDTFA